MDYRRAESKKRLTRRRGDAAETKSDGELSGSTAERPHQQIAVAVVEHDGKFLVGMRGPGKPLAGFSEFPGGKIHSGETPAEAAARECREETGLSVVVGEPYPTVEHDYPHSRLTLHFFRCTLANPAGNASPVEPFRWVNSAELIRLEFPAANRSLLAELAAEVGR
jgi:8-oxo-dGTP diphosphatase